VYLEETWKALNSSQYREDDIISDDEQSTKTS